jgi:hypothetical protein
MDTMLPERPRRRELAQTVPHHIFRDENRHVLLTVMDSERMPDEIRVDHGTARPRLDRLLPAGRIHFLDLIEQALLNVKALL